MSSKAPNKFAKWIADAYRGDRSFGAIKFEDAMERLTANDIDLIRKLIQSTLTSAQIPENTDADHTPEQD